MRPRLALNSQFKGFTVAQADLKLVILLPLCPRHWEYRTGPILSAYSLTFRICYQGYI